VVFFFFSFLAQRTVLSFSKSEKLATGEGIVNNVQPHALHSVLGPLGPFRHSGESSVPKEKGLEICLERSLIKG